MKVLLKVSSEKHYLILHYMFIGHVYCPCFSGIFFTSLNITFLFRDFTSKSFNKGCFTTNEKSGQNAGIECTSVNIEMTDKNFETAEFTSSEKQVRFSMTTIR